VGRRERVDLLFKQPLPSSLYPSLHLFRSHLPQSVQKRDRRRRGGKAREGVGGACQGRRAKEGETLRGDGLREGRKEGGREGCGEEEGVGGAC